MACLWHFLVGSLWHSCESVGGGEQKEKFFLSFPSPYYFLFLCSISHPYLSHAIFALGKEITAPQARVNPFRFVCQIPYFWSCDVFWTIICNYLKKMHSCAFLQSNVVWSEMGQQRMRGKSLFCDNHNNYYLTVGIIVIISFVDLSYLEEVRAQVPVQQQKRSDMYKLEML